MLGISFLFSFLLVQADYTSDVKFDDGINYESLVANINARHAQSLEQTLELVPKEFLNSYVLMYRSRSLQDSNPLYPRAIVFGRSAKFIMAFNGNDRHKGYKNLEIVQFREKEFRWEFREITFEEGQPPRFSEANPRKCLECHQSPLRVGVDPRPNWEPYNFWPGAYASVDDTIQPVLKADYEKHKNSGSSFLHSTLQRFLEQDFILIDEQEKEQANLEKFESTIKPTHPRYKFLGNFNTRAPLSLTKSTVTLNMRRVARIVRDELGDLFNVYKYSVLGLSDYVSPTSSAMLKYACGKLYMPETVRQKHLQIALKTRNLRQKDYEKPNPAYGWRHGIAAGIEILLVPLGIQTDDLSMDFRTNGRFGAQDRFTSPHSASTHLREAFELVYADDPAAAMDCKQLEAAAIKSLQEFDQSGGVERAISHSQNMAAQPTRQLLSRCISCHVNYEDGGQAPSIPFDNFSRLKPMLNENKYPRGTLFQEILYRTSDHAPLRHQMPPAGQVDRDSRDQFIKSIEALLLEP